MEPIDKKTLLENVRAGREAFDALLDQFSADGLEIAYPPDGWSVKDMMAHMTFWEQYALDRLQEAANGQTPQLLGDVTDEDLNRINQGILDNGPNQALDDVQAAYARTHQELVVLLDALPEASDALWWDLWPSRQVPLNVIGYNTTDHYEEHAADLRRWLAE